MNIGLALGGGGARCFAHLGVLRALEEHHIHAVAIAACSTGAVLGALYAAGHTPDRVRQLGNEVSEWKLANFKPGSGLLNQQGLEELLQAHLPRTFEELTIPLTALTVDIEKGELVALRTGPLLPALIASSAVPGMFNPVTLHGRKLVDSSVLDDVPVDAIRMLTHHQVVAVDTSQLPGDKRILGEGSGPLEGLAAPLRSGVEMPQEMFLRAYEYRNALLRQMHALYPPDLLINLEMDLTHSDFGRVDEAVEQGYEAADRELARWDGVRMRQPEPSPR